MAGTQHFSRGDVQFQLVYDRGQCADSSYLNLYQKRYLERPDPNKVTYITKNTILKSNLAQTKGSKNKGSKTSGLPVN